MLRLYLARTKVPAVGCAAVSDGDEDGREVAVGQAGIVAPDGADLARGATVATYGGIVAASPIWRII
ncbi:hypothetical protein [Arthrobacter sp. MYb213]|uniref:hypothetical protein n=1 Tax=Arthrobacter sp. MYb213 TaxID=1848595 RepID=UPI0011B07495|nr:hypothetical protein [Arthrobacter sp. MYb213]